MFDERYGDVMIFLVKILWVWVILKLMFQYWRPLVSRLWVGFFLIYIFWMFDLFLILQYYHIRRLLISLLFEISREGNLVIFLIPLNHSARMLFQLDFILRFWPIFSRLCNSNLILFCIFDPSFQTCFFFFFKTKPC